MKRFLMCVFGLMTAVACFGMQQPKSGLYFESKRFDFGTISESGGPVCHDFLYTNQSSVPLVIEQIVTTCGCTIVQYERKPVLPGEQKTLTLCFNPKGRAGTFNKSVRIVSNNGLCITSLFISGVIRSRQTEDRYSYELIDDVYVNRRFIRFQTLQHNAKNVLYDTVLLTNLRDKPIRITSRIINVSGCVAYKVPQQLKAGESGPIIISLFDKSGYYGSIKDKLQLFIDGLPAPTIDTFGYLVDDMSGLRIADAPICSISNGYLNFNKKARGEPVSHIITVKNTGKTTLRIRKIELDDKLSLIKPYSTKLLPNEKTDIHISINTNFVGTIDSNIRIITNDVKSPIKTLKIEGEIY